MLVAFRALPPDEQDASFEALADERARRQAGEESEAARFVRPLRRVADHLWGGPTVDDYRRAEPNCEPPARTSSPSIA
jgi:hypothetical protein